MSKFGVYITGNDAFCDEVVCLVKSLRSHNPDIAITLIPYAKDYQKILASCKIDLFPNLELVESLEKELYDLFYTGKLIPQRNKYPRLRNLLSFFGEYDTFVSLDADIIVMTDLEKFALKILEDKDFVCYDRIFKHKMKWVFTSEIKRFFSEQQLAKIFNGGFWVTRKSLFSWESLVKSLRECKQIPECFDYGNGAIAQPILNYIVLKNVASDKIRNPLLEDLKLPEPWAGFNYEQSSLGQLGQKDSVTGEVSLLPFLHWAGKEMGPTHRYGNLWSYYYAK